MISYKMAKVRSLEGDYNALIVAVEVENNNFYDPNNENSTEAVLDITFQLDDPRTGDPIMHTQKYVAPLAGGSGMFQQLLDILGLPPDIEGGELNEQQFVGIEAVVTMGKNKKGYNTVLSVQKKAAVTQKPSVPAGEEAL